jgi:hypothetical protein
MRQITTHEVGGLNEKIQLYAIDERGSGNANHEYHIDVFQLGSSAREGQNGDIETFRSAKHVGRWSIDFQKGPLKEAGANGISNEVLLAILIDRMQGFQSGPFASRENALALTKLEEAMMWLQKRTRDRLARGVEGTHQQ